MNTPDRIILVDGFALVYRTFYAIRELTNPRGEPVNALYGLARMLLKLEQDFPHRYGAVVFDRGRPARRVSLLPEYKATRPPMPDALRQQLDPIWAWIAASGWPLVVEEGREADDLIAAIAVRREGRETGILSHDKDLMQLVTGDQVYLLQSSGGVFQRIGPQDVEAKFGVPPGCIRDFLALLGDSSDNIPGVPGVGAKTAAALLREYGSAAAVMEKLDQIERPSIRESLRASVDIIRRNIALVELDLEPPPGWTGVQDLRRTPPDWGKLVSMAQDHGFRSLVSALEKGRDAEREPSLF